MLLESIDAELDYLTNLQSSMASMASKGKLEPRETKLLDNLHQELAFLITPGLFLPRRPDIMLRLRCDPKWSDSTQLGDATLRITTRSKQFRVKMHIPLTAYFSYLIFSLPIFEVKTPRRRWINSDYDDVCGILADLKHLRKAACTLHFRRTEQKIMYRLKKCVEKILHRIDILPKFERDVIILLHSVMTDANFQKDLQLIRLTGVLGEDVEINSHGRYFKPYDVNKELTLLELNKSMCTVTFQQIPKLGGN